MPAPSASTRVIRITNWPELEELPRTSLYITHSPTFRATQVLVNSSLAFAMSCMWPCGIKAFLPQASNNHSKDKSVDYACIRYATLSQTVAAKAAREMCVPICLLADTERASPLVMTTYFSCQSMTQPELKLHCSQQLKNNVLYPTTKLASDGGGGGDPKNHCQLWRIYNWHTDTRTHTHCRHSEKKKIRSSFPSSII